MWTRDEALALARHLVGPMFGRNILVILPYCPGPARSSGAPPVAAAAWADTRDLPVPVLASEPPHAVAGKAVYLQIHGPDSWEATVDNPIGDDVTITATSYYEVDWDDPTWGEATLTRSHGGPWPDGDVTHIYTHLSPGRSVRVTQHWEAWWMSGGRWGALPGLVTQSEPLVLEVRQIVAVRNR
ncbi:MAG: hypothetical protein ACRD0M_06800 [Acidimicrobiales bacterium]